jgi:8-amino-7-oxononanoate synthase
VNLPTHLDNSATPDSPPTRPPIDFDATYRGFCEGLAQQHLYRVLPQHRPEGVEIDFSSNDYLGLSRHPALLAAAHRALDEAGVGSTGSRLLSGNVPCHEALEQQIAHCKGTESALLFCSGYQANATVLAALLDKRVTGRDAVVLSDRLIHASLHHACRYAGVEHVRFRHNDMDHLETLLQEHGAAGKLVFIVGETVYGMDGDVAPLDTLDELAARYGAFLYLDEAHATGIMGRNGYGLLAGRQHPPGFIAMGTFSKAIGCSGAYIACSQAVRNYLVNRCSGFVYSTAPSPAMTAAISSALSLLPSLQGERDRVSQNAALLREHLRSLGLECGPSTTHIVPIIVREETRALALKAFLLTRGILASAVRPPTVPRGTARVRVALCATHTDNDLQALHSALSEWVREPA